ncbi:MAG: sulfurtransferase TusA family protein [Paracoccaceae bacterium]
MDWDAEVDCEGLLCPLPVLRAAKRLRAMEPGAVLCLRATDRMAAVDLPHFCGQAGHDYLGAQEEGSVTLHLIRRGTGPARA